MKRKLPLLALGGLLLGLYMPATSQAQRKCGIERLEEAVTHGDAHALQAIHQQRQQFIRDAQARMAQLPAGALKTTGIHPVPVVFHIVLTQAQYNRLGGQAGIANRVDSQMAVINRDYNRQNWDSASIPAAFKPLYGNPQIRFSLARKKPDGSATSGFEIKVLQSGADSTFDIQSGSSGSHFACSDAKYNTAKGFASWDVNKYLNVWVVRITDNGADGILGVTISPQTASQFGIPATERGVVLTSGAFGKRVSAGDYYISGIDRGRTLTHELGHYFELPHIWGDDNGACPPDPTYVDDGFTDTPPQADENYGCPNFPSISCSNGPNGDMFMNYMDYTNDACMFMFSKQQSSLMNSLIQSGGESYPLTQNPDLLSVTDVKYGSDFSIAPNPTNGQVFINFAQQPKDLQGIDVVNMMGQHLLRLPANATGSYTADLSGLSKGIYFVQCRFSDGAITRKIVLQ